MDGGTSLAATSGLMFVGAYLAGLLPSVVRLDNPKHIQTINAAGAGLLLGAALCVVLPEGFITFSEAQAHVEEGLKYPDWVLGFSLLFGFLAMMGLQVVAEPWGEVMPDGHTHQCASSLHKAPHGSGLDRGADGSAADLEAVERQCLLHSDSRGSDLPAPWSPGPTSILSTASQALYGLVIHSAADGLAVGSACMSGNMRLTLSVGVAILIHKFPVAFGLSSYLRGAGWHGARLQKGLLMFCAAAPVTAIATYLILGQIALLTDARNVALCMLFSGGTVLHAGLVHVLPSAFGSNDGHAHAPWQTDNILCDSDVQHVQICEDASCQAGALANAKANRGLQQHRVEKAKLMVVLVLSSLVPLAITALVPESG